MNSEEVKAILANSEELVSGQGVRMARRELARGINQHFGDREIYVVTIMNGGMMFAAELVEHLDMPITMDYIHLSRYGNKMLGSSTLSWIVIPTTSMKGADVLLLDDIYDQGMTLSFAKDACYSVGARTVTTAVLCTKQGIDHKWSPPDFSALWIPNRFVFGSGMDYKGYLRNVEGIQALKEDVQ